MRVAGSFSVAPRRHASFPSPPVASPAGGAATATKPATDASHSFAPSPPAVAFNPLDEVPNQKLVEMVQEGKMKLFDLERQLGNYERAVHVRRMVVGEFRVVT